MGAEVYHVSGCLFYRGLQLACVVAELEEVLAEAQRVSPQVDAYLADNGHSNGKSNSKKQNKPISRSNDLEAQ